MKCLTEYGTSAMSAPNVKDRHRKNLLMYDLIIIFETCACAGVNTLLHHSRTCAICNRFRLTALFINALTASLLLHAMSASKAFRNGK